MTKKRLLNHRIFGLTSLILLFAPFLGCMDGPQATFPENGMEMVGSQGLVDFALVDEEIAKDAILLERLAREHCDEHRDSFCQVMIWRDRDFVPVALPMSEAEMEAQIAQYHRNRNTDRDCFYVISDGVMTSKYPDCN